MEGKKKQGRTGGEARGLYFSFHGTERNGGIRAQ